MSLVGSARLSMDTLSLGSQYSNPRYFPDWHIVNSLVLFPPASSASPYTLEPTTSHESVT
eukprot:13597387-Ditylum_brightwellii.AAC.1